MKKIIILLLLIASNLHVNAQVVLDIKEMTLYGLDAYHLLPSDSLIYSSIIENNRLGISATVEIKNISDTIIALNPCDSCLFITYISDSDVYKSTLSFVELKDDRMYNIYDKEKYLKPSDKIILSAQGLFIEENKNMKWRENVLFLLKILPTLKFNYIDKRGIHVCHNNIMNVKIEIPPL